MRTKYFFSGVLFALSINLVGCSSTSSNRKVASYNPEVTVTKSEEKGNSQERLEVRERIEVPQGMDTETEDFGDDYSTATAAPTPTSDTKESNTKKSRYTWQEISIDVPISWNGKYTIKEEENGFTIIQKASQEIKRDLGTICSIYRSKDMLPTLGEVRPLAYTDDTMYYMMIPTDVSYYHEDEQIKQEYETMVSRIDEMCSSIKVDLPKVHYDPTEYILPQSSTKRFKKEDLTHLNDNELWIARNEIFAKHGRVYTGDYLKNYFASCSWYKSKKGADKNKSVGLNKIEIANLAVIKNVEASYKKKHTYPKKGRIGKLTRVDLNGDGKQEQLCVKMNYKEKGNKESHNIAIQINGKEYRVESDTLSFAMPEEKYFYITDISSTEPGLEIALLDYGASNDYVTHFFSFDKKDMNYLGSVSGFPFREFSELDGFLEDGCITGTLRTDLIHTCFSYATWHYNLEKKTIALQEAGNYTMVPEGAHELYVDLPVYYGMSEESGTFTLSSQKKVYFIETDGIEWIKVKGKDGKAGYIKVKDSIIMNNGMEATQVFGNLGFCD